MTRAARRAVALGAGAATGAALATLLLPELANTLGPSPAAIALLTTALAFLTTGVQRFVELSKRRSALQSALRAWPVEPIREIDLATLGVYPARGISEEKYVSRPGDEDEKLCRALRGSYDLVVCGPRGAGKSRAASFAARRVFGDVPVVVH